jgi:hypothetical protein
VSAVIALLALLLLAATASAHIVPVPPSTCAFDPLTIEAPAAAVAGTAAPAGPSDQFRILYDPQASQAEFDMQSLPPRSFTAAGVDGTLALPGILLVALRNSGDLVVTTSLAFTLNAATTSVPMTLTTGLAAAAGLVVEGMPIASDGRFALVGVTADSGLGPPLAGGLLTVRLAGQAVPRPDTDQFFLATRTTPVSASLTARAFKLRAIFSPGATDTPDFAGSPVILRVSSGDTTIATVDLPSGLPARGRKLFIGHSDDGRAAFGVRQLQRSGQVAFLLAAKIKGPVLPAVNASPVAVTFTYDAGGLLSHLSLPMRVKRHGAVLHYP